MGNHRQPRPAASRRFRPDRGKDDDLQHRINQRARTRQFRQSAAPFNQNGLFFAVFTQWVCSLATTPPQVVASPPANGGNCTTSGATRRRHADSQLLMLQNPHHSQPRAPGCIEDRRRVGWREKTRPEPPLQQLFREKTRPARVKTPILGCFERAGRTFSRSRPHQAEQGELFRARGTTPWRH